MGVDLSTAYESTLIRLAARAFQLGVRDADASRRIKDGSQLMAALELPEGSTWRKFHRHKFRQVYGAGYDMMRSTKRFLSQS